MRHLLLILYILLFFTSLSASVWTGFRLIQKKMRNDLFNLFFFVSLSANIFLDSVSLYIKVNLYFENQIPLIAYTAGRGISFILMPFVAIILHEIFDFPRKKAANTVMLFLCSIIFLLMIPPYLFKFILPGIFFSYNPFITVNSIIFALSIYIIILFAKYARRLNERQIFRTAVITGCYFLFLLAHTFIFSWNFYLENSISGIHWMNLLFYTFWTLLFLVFFIQFQPEEIKIKLGESLPDERFIRKYSLTQREAEIVCLIVSGKTNPEIAETLFISPKTVKAHIYNIYQKTRVNTRIRLSMLINQET